MTACCIINKGKTRTGAYSGSSSSREEEEESDSEEGLKSNKSALLNRYNAALARRKLERPPAPPEKEERGRGEGPTEEDQGNMTARRRPNNLAPQNPNPYQEEEPLGEGFGDPHGGIQDEYMEQRYWANQELTQA
jgi:hypothetical protein